MKSLIRRRKRGASAELTYGDAVSERLVTESPAYSSSLATQSPPQSDYRQSFPVKQMTGSTASSSSLSDGSWIEGQTSFPPEKRAKFSQDERISFPMQTTASRYGAIWNCIPSASTSDSIALLQAFPEAAQATRTSDHGAGSGWPQAQNPIFSYGSPSDFEMWGTNADREKLEERRRVMAADGARQHPASALDSHPTGGPATETVCSIPGSLYSSSQFNEADLLHQVAPSAAFSTDDASSLQSAWRGPNDGSRATSFDTFIASFLNSYPEVAGNVEERNQPKNDSSEQRDQVSVTEIRNLSKAALGSTDARRIQQTGEIASGSQGRVTASSVLPYPVGMTDSGQGTTDRNVYEMQRSRFLADRASQRELTGCHPGQSNTAEWSLPTTGIPLPVGSVSLPPSIHGLPFPLPPVPSGYKLVITHQSLPPAGKENAVQPQKETRIIIIHPAQDTPSTTSGHSDQNPLGHTSITTYQSSPPTLHPPPFFPHPHHVIAQQKPSGAVQQLPLKSPVCGVRRPADFDLPQKTSAQYLPYSTDHGFKSSSPMTSALDLSVSSILTQTSNPEQSASRYQTAIQKPTHPISPCFTNAIWQNGTSGIQHALTTAHTMTTSASQRLTSSSTHILTNSDSRISLTPTVYPTSSEDGRVYLSTGEYSFTSRPTSGQVDHHPGPLSNTTPRSSSVDHADLSTEGHLDDVMFPPNVVIGPSCCPGRRMTSGRFGNACAEDLSPVTHAQRPSLESGSGRPPSPASTVEPDSTVQPGQRDIIRAALTDKIRRNRTQRRISDNLVSTTSQSPNTTFSDGQSPRSEPTVASPNQHPHSEPPASESTEIPQGMHQLHQQHLGTHTITSRNTDVTVLAKPVQVGIKEELPPSPTSAADRASSNLASPSAGHHSPREEESGGHGNHDSTETTESSDQVYKDLCSQ